MVMVAAALAATAVVLRWPPPGWVWWLRLGKPEKTSLLQASQPIALLGALTAACVAFAPAGPLTLVIFAASCAAWFGLRRYLKHRDHETRAHHAQETAEIIEVLASTVSAGFIGPVAIEVVSREFEVLAPVAKTASTGADAATAWETLATEPGREGFVELAMVWRVAEESGAPLADILQELGQVAADERELLRDVDSEVAPARATGTVMALLPLIGLVLASGLGASPLEVVSGNWISAFSVTLGIGIAVLGLAWTDRIAARGMP